MLYQGVTAVTVHHAAMKARFIYAPAHADRQEGTPNQVRQHNSAQQDGATRANQSRTKNGMALYGGRCSASSVIRRTNQFATNQYALEGEG